MPPKRRGRIASRENGGLMTTADAEQLDEIPKAVEGMEAGEAGEAEEGGRGKRKKTANTMYSLADFAQHWDNEASDVE
jgi:hypothetical protein